MTKNKPIDEKSAISHAGETTKKLVFTNGSTIEFKEDMEGVNWNAVEGMIIERWLTKEEIKKLYPEVKID